jgi:hypothetical protein
MFKTMVFEHWYRYVRYGAEYEKPRWPRKAAVYSSLTRPKSTTTSSATSPRS